MLCHENAISVTYGAHLTGDKKIFRFVFFFSSRGNPNIRTARDYLLSRKRSYVVNRFINQTFIENEYINPLNPCEFQWKNPPISWAMFQNSSVAPITLWGPENDPLESLRLHFFGPERYLLYPPSKKLHQRKIRLSASCFVL
jgi:hypothetical protein